MKFNLKAYYEFAEETVTVNYKVGPLLEKDGSLPGNPMRIIEILNGQFKSDFNPPS